EENNTREEKELNPQGENNTLPEEEVNRDEKTQQDAPEQEEETLAEEDTLKAELSEWQTKHPRLYAKFDNFKRRTSKERRELLSMAGKDVIVDLLPVLDDFERAQKSMETATDIEAVKEGVKLIHHKMKSVLSQKGLKEMKSIGT